MTEIERFNKFVVVYDKSNCMLWCGCLDWSGHGQFKLSSGSMTLAHRYLYELTHGPIPNGQVTHHQCSNRNCVNPDHIEIISRGEHTAIHNAKSLCKRGHEFTIGSDGKKICLICAKHRKAEWYRKRAALGKITATTEKGGVPNG